MPVLMLYDRHLRRVHSTRTRSDDSGRFRHNRGRRYNEVGVSSSVLGNLRSDVQRLSIQQTPAELYTVPLHWRVGDQQRAVFQQFVRTGILSTKTLSRLETPFFPSDSVLMLQCFDCMQCLTLFVKHQ